MIDILTNVDRRARAEDFDAMHLLRGRVFKDRLGWEVDCRDGRERDAFDDLDPTYLLAFGPTGAVAGSWRLLPTTGPYMMKDTEAFHPLLKDGEAPRRPRLWEASRFAVDMGSGSDGGLAAVGQITAELFHGLVEHCMAEGIEEILTVYDRRIARLLPRVGCHPLWTVGPMPIGGVPTHAGLFDAGPAMLAAIREATGISGSVVGHAPWRKGQAA
ncbi:acyl-homoserine-lactone synthase [Inquilinus sp. CAU 1745]|uniref:acyl-homoserine-lactone synthase n=1 Tax=Inquilinus sp. CAU 1745 TaxID=3140369 RepID=UPI00325C342A